MIRVLFSARPGLWADWQAPLTQAIAEQGIKADLVTIADPGTVDYIVYAPNGPVQDFTPFTRLRAVFGIWAGVETIAPNPTLQVPLTRMVDPGLTLGMRDWVVGHTLRHHLGMDAHIQGQDGVWRGGIVPPLARDRSVGVLGLGALGSAAATALAGLGFRVLGWSRRPRNVPGVLCHSGDEGLAAVLAQAEILVLLLPLTAATENLLDAERLARLPEGAVIVNPGRGALIDDDALLAALDGGRIGHATLDVFRTEPLPPDHPFWTHPRVTVTPHIASETRPETASKAIAENLRRAVSGAPLRNVVDRSAGY